MTEYLIITLQLVLSLSILVTLHEMGHFFPARWFGMRVEKFYLFFNPWFSVFKVQKGETEYGIGWLPLGGYVKIAGMMDESMDTEALKLPPQPWEFRSKPAWQRLIVMLGGVTVNFILGFFILGILLWLYGDVYVPSKEAKYGITCNNVALDLGLENGDHIQSVGGQPFDKFDGGMIVREILFNHAKSIKVLRNGQPVSVPVHDSMVSRLASNKKTPLIAPRMPFVAGKIIDGSPASKAGIEVNDSIIACNGTATPFFSTFKKTVSEHKSEEVTVTVVRKGETKDIQLTTTESGTVGVAPFGPSRFFNVERQTYGFFAAMPLGVVRGWDFIMNNIRAFGQMFSGRIKASESLGGFGSIAKLFPSHWDWERFWRMTAILSLILGFMNLLPIPALDGGHAVFLLYEIVARRPVNQKVMEYAQVLGFLILIALLVYANGLDIYRAFQ
ncbi:MAG: RIP metalloprotease RseP [Aureispira sp.]|nr:RIP metalloprotease RseP [Aureispira sp.]